MSAVAYFAWRWLFYAVFGAQWIELVHKTRADFSQADPVPYLVSFATSLVVAYATAIALRHDSSAARGAQFGLFMGLCFVAATMLTDTLFEGRPVELWLLSAGCAVTGMAIVGAIVGGWKKESSAS